MKARYVSYPDDVRDLYKLNTSALAEVLTGDDSVYFKDLEVQLPDGSWKNLSQAFKDRDVVTDNYNQYFREARTAQERERGWYDD